VDDLATKVQQAVGSRFTVERELGRGGMATVFLARDLRHDRRVALKVLRTELAAWIGRDRFLREIRLTAGFDHPHIVPVLDSGGDDAAGGTLWYTMPFVEGESLRARLQREGRLPLAEAVRLTGEIADALGYAHRRGVVHRDIKPENVLLSEGHARVADFGIAWGGATEGDGRLTATGIVVGTPAYMSPEQSAGGEVDARSDIYVLGCVTYEMLAGRPPHTGITPQAIIARRYREPYPLPDPSLPPVPATVEPVLRRALAIEPEDRYATVREYAAALAGAADAKAPASAPVARLPWRTVFGGVAAVAVIGAAALTFRRSLPPAAPGAPGSGPVRIAVLPFANLGDTSRGYLTDGLADAVRGRLAALPSLEVIASSSTEPYRRSAKSLREIGRELDVRYVLVGKVRWVGGGMRNEMQVSPELVHVSTGATRWQDAIQAGEARAPSLPAEIARAIVGALGVPVTAVAKSALRDTLTANPEAWELYLRASDYLHRISLFQAPTSMLNPAIAMLRKAIALDTGFALAKVRLAGAVRYAGMTSGGDSARYAEADSLLGAVLARHPTMAEALQARGKLRQVQGDLDAALQLYQEAAAVQPGNADIQGALTFLQALRLDSAALVTGARAVALAPRDADMLRQVIQGTSIFRNADQLERYSDRLIELDAGDPNGYFHKALVRLWQGDTAAALAALRRSEGVSEGTPALIAWGYAMSGPSGWQRWHALRLGDLASPERRDTAEYYWYKGQVAGAEHRPAAERVYADSLRRFLAGVKRTDPFYGVALAQQGWSRAILGDRHGARQDLAAAESKLARESPSALVFWQYVLASAYAAVGDTAAAIGATRRLLERPSEYNRRSVRLAPEFARLRGVEGFERVLADSSLP
jgi:serine/threonine-protein kinase